MAVLNLIVGLLFIIFSSLFEKAFESWNKTKTEEDKKKSDRYEEVSMYLYLLLLVINLSEKTLLNYLLCRLYCLTKQEKKEANTCQFVL